MKISKDYKISELISKQAIEQRIKELGKEISKDYQGSTETLVLVGVLKGSIIFLADLCRSIDLPIEIEMMGVSSYGDETVSSGEVRITQDLTRPIKGKHILIVEDILDTGLTLKYLLENLRSREPKSVKVCTFLHKDCAKKANIALDYIGFHIPDQFVVGYGLDVAEKLRNIPFLGVYPTKKQEVDA